MQLFLDLAMNVVPLKPFRYYWTEKDTHLWINFQRFLLDNNIKRVILNG